MGAVSSWLLSITGIVILSVLTEFVLPEGQINKYIKVIFSFVILLVIILPLPKVFGKDFDLSKYFSNSESSLQEDYLYQVNLDKLTTMHEEIAQEIKEAGLLNVEVSINANVLQQELEIFGVYVNLKEIEYDDDFSNKDILTAKATIKKILEKYSILKNVEVKFDE